MNFEERLKQEQNAYVSNLGPQDDAYTLKVFEYAGQTPHEWFFRTLCFDAPLECCLGYMREHAKPKVSSIFESIRRGIVTDDEGGVYIIMQGDRRVYTHYVDPDMHGDLAVEPYCFDHANRMLGFENIKGEELEGIIGDGGFCSDYELEIIKGFVG